MAWEMTEFELTIPKRTPAQRKEKVHICLACTISYLDMGHLRYLTLDLDELYFYQFEWFRTGGDGCRMSWSVPLKLLTVIAKDDVWRECTVVYAWLTIWTRLVGVERFALEANYYHFRSLTNRAPIDPEEFLANNLNSEGRRGWVTWDGYSPTSFAIITARDVENHPDPGQ